MSLKLFSLDMVDSTMKECLRRYKDNPALLDEGFAVIAKRQTNGRGQYGRSWFSDSEDGLYYSCMLAPKSFLIDQHETELFQIAERVSDVIQRECGVLSSVQLPNDVMIRGKKVAGVLAQIGSVQHQSVADYLIIGIGLNVNHATFPEELSPIATSLFLETRKRFSIIRLADVLSTALKTHFFLVKSNQNIS